MNHNEPRIERPSLLKSIGKALCYFLLFFGMQTLVSSVWLSVKMVEAMETGEDIWALYDLLYEKSMDLSTVANAITLLFLLVFFKLRKKSVREELMLRRTPGKLLAWSAALAFCLYWLVSLVLSLLPESVMAGYDEASAGLYDTGFLAVVGTALISPIVEEIVFRGLIYSRLERSMRPATAVAVSAMIFAFCHGQMVWVCYACVLGVIFGHVTSLSRSLLPALLMHIVFNTTNEILVLLGDWQPGVVGAILILLVGVGGTLFCGRKVLTLAALEYRKAWEAAQAAEKPAPDEPVAEAQEPARPTKPARAAWDADSGAHHRFPPERM